MFAETRDTHTMLLGSWAAQRLLDMASMLYAQHNSKDAEKYERSCRGDLPGISSLIDPYIQQHEEERRRAEALRQKSSEQKQEFMSGVEGMDFRSVEDIVAAVTGRRGTLVEVKKDQEQQL